MHDKQKDLLNHERVVKIHAPKRDNDEVVQPSEADPVFPLKVNTRSTRTAIAVRAGSIPA